MIWDEFLSQFSFRDEEDGGIKAEFLQLYLNEFCYKFNRRYFGFRLFERLELCACTYRAEFKHRIY